MWPDQIPLRHPRRRPAWLRPVLMMLCVLVTVAASTVVEAAEIDFDRDVAPIFIAHCLDCHGDSDAKAELSLSRSDRAAQGGESGTAIAAGNADESLLWNRIADDEMPPEHPLSDQEKGIIKRWIDEGAAWGTDPIDPFAATTDARAGRDWWSLQPLRASAPPELVSDNWGRNPIDAFVLQRLQERELKPSPEADPRTLVRRLYFDLIGLPPTPDQVTAFAADPSDQAYDQLVDDLLASQHYGERWGRHWLDVVRFGESDGFERNMPRENAWHYRDWVIDALNADLPYDRFVRQQLIGDQLDSGVDGAAATGFWVAGVHNTVIGGSERMKQLARQDEVEEVLAVVGQTFLGLTINCARCHDHKFDPITQKEYYQLASAISGLGYGERTVKDESSAAELARLQQQRRVLSEQLAAIEQPARKAILAARQTGERLAPEPPQAFAFWDFEEDLRDRVGNLHGRAEGTARLESGALLVDGEGFVQTAALPKDITEKTLQVWIQLDALDQGGGGAITIESRDGVVFDSIVFAEQEPQRWMAGSNSFTRTESFQGTDEDQAQQRPVQVTLVYHADGTIRGYRDGLAYGQPIRKSPLQPYKADETEILFGLRHKPLAAGRTLRGRIEQAALYDRALSAAEVAASAGPGAAYVSPEEIAEWLDPPQRQQRESLQQQIAGVDQALADQAALVDRKLYTLTANSGATAHVLLRGDPDNVGEVVAPAAVASLTGVNADFQLPPDAPESIRRTRLAEWITDPANPLFPRVAVNRLWHYHFGTGILDTPNDFGFNGGRASHPDLLEYLAARFRDNGFATKALHRLIVTSSTYRQASRGQSEKLQQQAMATDANNRLLWKGPARRLEAESIRDAMLSVAGKLNDVGGGPSFKDVSVEFISGTTYYEPLDVDGEAFFRRTVYRFNPRGGRSALLDTFDCPDPATAAPRRAVTTTPLQALSLLNNAFVLRMSEYFASRVESEVGEDIAAQVDRAWQLALARGPSEQERRLSVALAEQHGLPALCRGLFNANEFVIVD